VLRYGEWVYFLLGVVVLCLVVNSVALLLLYFRIEEQAPDRRPVAGAKEAPPVASAPSGDLDASRKVPSEVKAGATGSGGPSDPAPGVAAPVGEPAPPPPPAPSSNDAPRPRSAEEAAATGPSVEQAAVVPGGAQATSPPAGVLRLRAPGEDAEAMIFTSRPGARKPPDAAPGKAWLDEPPLLRLFILERLDSEPLLAHAFLGDPEGPLRSAAVERVIARGPPPGLEDRAAAAALVLAAQGALAQDPRGGKILAAYGELKTSDPRAAGATEAVLAGLRSRAGLALAAPGVNPLKDFLATSARNGLDVVLLIDGSRSMEGALEALQADALWLFPALAWSFPGLRLGVIIYRDAVDAATGFGGTPGDALQALREARPERGGDVPEGVHQAVQAALSLGRFAWRQEAEKHLVLIGDAPPPYAEVHALLSLMRAAHSQGQYRLHALGVRPAEGRDAVPFFPELAKEGRGRSATFTDPGEIAAGVFLALLPRESAAIGQSLAGAIERLFGGED
jgi:hypothetical protein